MRSECPNICSMRTYCSSIAHLPNQTWRRSSRASRCTRTTHQDMRQANIRSIAINPSTIQHCTRHFDEMPAYVFFYHDHVSKTATFVADSLLQPRDVAFHFRPLPVCWHQRRANERSSGLGTWNRQHESVAYYAAIPLFERSSELVLPYHLFS